MSKHTFDFHTLRAAFSATIPVLFGYLAIGLAFGLLLQNAGYPWVFALIMSVFIYAGAAQYLAVGLFANNAGLLEIATITFLVNFRHMIYGLSLFRKFALTNKFKPYMIFSLTDETYALLTSVTPSPEVKEAQYYFYIALLNHSYWIIGSVLGAVAAQFVTFNTQGLDFALTALFVVLLMEQYTNSANKLVFVIGGVCAFAPLILLGKENMLLYAVILAIAALITLKKRIRENECK
ncbi:MAG: AzlC family protein [Firmicutes bacterium]|nr:AzlC family protein [Bacillota bacterium]